METAILDTNMVYKFQTLKLLHGYSWWKQFESLSSGLDDGIWVY